MTYVPSPNPLGAASATQHSSARSAAAAATAAAAHVLMRRAWSCSTSCHACAVAHHQSYASVCN
eukprot:3005695-Alexandrium_andersonii.AAC.1